MTESEMQQRIEDERKRGEKEKTACGFSYDSLNRRRGWRSVHHG